VRVGGCDKSLFLWGTFDDPNFLFNGDIPVDFIHLGKNIRVSWWWYSALTVHCVIEPWMNVTLQSLTRSLLWIILHSETLNFHEPNNYRSEWYSYGQIDCNLYGTVTLPWNIAALVKVSSWSLEPNAFPQTKVFLSAYSLTIVASRKPGYPSNIAMAKYTIVQSSLNLLRLIMI
jgi:hypothetical protein